MTGPTPETLPRHELVGLYVEVVEASDPGMVGISGRVVSETTNTLLIAGTADSTSREWQVPKAGTTFEFALTDEAAPDREAGGTASELRSETAGEEVASNGVANLGKSGRCEGVAYVTVDGARLLSRPARRTETGGAPKWR